MSEEGDSTGREDSAREDLRTNGLGSQQGDGAAGRADGLEAETDSLNVTPADDGKGKKKRGRRAKKNETPMKGRMEAYLLRSRDVGAFATRPKLDRTPPKDVQRAPRGKGAGYLTEEEEQVDDPEPVKRVASMGSLVGGPAAVTETKEAKKGSETVEDRGTGLGKGQRWNQKIDRKEQSAFETSGLNTDSHEGHKCPTCGGPGDQRHKGDMQRMDQRLKGLEDGLRELLSRENTGIRPTGENRDPTRDRVLGDILMEVGDIRESVDTLKGWVAEGLDDLRRQIELTWSKDRRQMGVEKDRRHWEASAREVHEVQEVQEGNQDAQIGTFFPGHELSISTPNSEFEIAPRDHQRLEMRDPPYVDTTGDTSGRVNQSSDREEDISQKRLDALDGLAWRMGAPGKLGEGEWQYEKRTRKRRLHGVLVRGLRAPQGIEAVEFTKRVKSITGLNLKVLVVKKLWSQELLFTLGNHHQKRQLVRTGNLKALEREGILVDDDLTERQKEVGVYLQGLAQRALEMGKTAHVLEFQQSVWLSGIKMRWNEERAELTVEESQAGQRRPGGENTEKSADESNDANNNR